MGVDLLAGAGEGVLDGAALGRAPRIAVFDSGLGGLTVHAEIARQLPGASFVYLGDTAVFPYGRLSDEDLVRRVEAVIGQLIAAHAPDLVVIACNTASTLALPVLRARFALPFVGTVPAVKSAARLSQSRRFSILATPGTVARDYTRELIAAHAADCGVTLVGSRSLASLAEAALRGEAADDAAISAEIAPAFVEDAAGRTDAVVLACTHYPLLLERLEALAPWPVSWIDPAPAIARRVAALVGSVAQAGFEPEGARALFTRAEPLPAALVQMLGQRGFVEIGREAC